VLGFVKKFSIWLVYVLHTQSSSIFQTQSYSVTPLFQAIINVGGVKYLVVPTSAASAPGKPAAAAAPDERPPMVLKPIEGHDYPTFEVREIDGKLILTQLASGERPQPLKKAAAPTANDKSPAPVSSFGKC
jgi:hypothetical protein